MTRRVSGGDRPPAGGSRHPERDDPLVPEATLENALDPRSFLTGGCDN